MQGPAGFAREPVAQSFGLAPDGGEILVARRHQWAHQKGADAAAELVLLLSLLEFSQALVDDFSDPDFALAFARIENHYCVHGGWLEEGQLIAGVDAIRSIPAVIVQGRYDLPCPARTAWDLHRAWPQADLRLVQAGHAATEPAIAAELVSATDSFA